VVIIVVAIILLVILVPIVLAAVLYVFVSGSIDGQPETPPTVAFAPAQTDLGDPDRFFIGVAAVDRMVSLSDFRVSLAANFGPRLCAPPCTLAGGVLDALAGLSLSFNDTGSGGTLSQGDVFILNGTTAGNIYTLRLLWGPSGNLVTSREIAT